MKRTSRLGWAFASSWQWTNGHYPKLIQPWRQSICPGESGELLGWAVVEAIPECFWQLSNVFVPPTMDWHMAYAKLLNQFPFKFLSFKLDLRFCIPFGFALKVGCSWYWSTTARLHDIWIIWRLVIWRPFALYRFIHQEPSKKSQSCWYWNLLFPVALFL